MSTVAAIAIIGGASAANANGPMFIPHTNSRPMVVTAPQKAGFTTPRQSFAGYRRPAYAVRPIVYARPQPIIVRNAYDPYYYSAPYYVGGGGYAYNDGCYGNGCNGNNVVAGVVGGLALGLVAGSVIYAIAK